MSNDDLIPRKRCPRCSTVYEGSEVSTMYSCDQCGNGHLSDLAPRRREEDPSHRLPRGGGERGTITHTRDGF